MNIEELTIKETRELAAIFGGGSAIAPHPYEIGAPYFIRTVTHHFTGRLQRVTAGELVLSQCCWIADDGRFADALKSGNHNEVEPYPEGSEVIIGRGSIIDAVKYQPKLPSVQK